MNFQMKLSINQVVVSSSFFSFKPFFELVVNDVRYVSMNINQANLFDLMTYFTAN